MKTMNIGRGLMAVILVLSLLLSFGGSAPVAASQTQLANDLRISQVYGGGGNSGATYTHDFVEIFNAGAAPVSLNGMSVQYTSATGTGNFGATATQITELPDVMLQPGQYYLIQESGGTTGAPLPAPDFIDATPINLSGTGGKVIIANTAVTLGCNGVSTGCTPEQLALIVDLVGYGGANFFEGTAAAPTLSNTTAGLRADAGCTDTDDNAADFTAVVPAPRNTASPTHSCVVSQPSIALSKTVGADPASCATTHEIALPADGGEVTYCYEVTNTGTVTLTLHTLDDSELGNLFTGLSYALAPGASAFITETATIITTTVNMGLWTAYNVGPTDVVTATDVATVTVEASNPSIVLTKTVGTDPNSCATTDELALPPGGGEVTYCYEVENTGNVTLTLHDLDDSELGNIFSGLSYALAPAASVFVTESATITTTTVNSAQWTAYNEGEPSVTATDVATVTVESANPSIVLTKTVGTDPLSCATTDELALPPGGGEVTYCYEVENTGNLTLNLHDLDDSELGNLFTSLSYALAPGASAFITETATVNATTVNVGIWTAYNVGPTDVVTATDVATVTVGTFAGVCPVGPEVGELAVSDPVFNRPQGFGGSCSLSGVGTAVYYDVYSYSLGGPPPHDLFASLIGGATMDTVLVFYQAPDGSPNPFDPTQGCLNSVAYNDDSGAGAQSEISATGLGAGWVDVVVTTFSNGVTGAYNMAVASESCQGTSITLTKTVGTVPGECATTNDITVIEGTEVYYCFQIQNTGNVTLTVHDLVDTQLGSIFTAFHYDLAPGALSPQVIVPETLFVTTVNTATWTASIVGGPTATATDSARVVVTPSAVIVTGLRASASSGWSSIALLGAVVFGGLVWRRKRR